MQEEVENKTLTLMVNGTRFTGRMFKAAIAKYMAHRREVKHQKQHALPPSAPARPRPDTGQCAADGDFPGDHNCVFVGRNSAGKPVFAAKRGTYDLNGAAFRGGVPGSDKEVAFRLPCDSRQLRVFVFEAPIDLMSSDPPFP